MLTVLVECCDQEGELAQTLAVLVAGAVKGIISDVVVLDKGSRDGTSSLADAAGCRFHLNGQLNEIIASVRGEWLLLVEPGARPVSGWIEEIADYVAMNTRPARFAPSRFYRRPILSRLMRRGPPLEHGFLMQKQQALQIAKADMALADLTRGLKGERLMSEIVPAWAARSTRLTQTGL
ncbi:glycosyl transferase [Allorhizobium sp. BGMRC 0089]|uniref:glycosyl transferase n=1 Tax=Allorhizobium sonneratiae TaxID=2934936 RepID=UPI0020335AB1|nr:glycosyl transferase [Allorhizobium sonneratiae]MCM2291298.1 glycosyl transferase [Allorhizobium sonneratiae]